MTLTSFLVLCGVCFGPRLRVFVNNKISRRSREHGPALPFGHFDLLGPGKKYGQIEVGLCDIIGTY